MKYAISGGKVRKVRWHPAGWETDTGLILNVDTKIFESERDANIQLLKDFIKVQSETVRVELEKLAELEQRLWNLRWVKNQTL